MKERVIPGINIQWPWSQLIASGKKIVETRTYPIPNKYIMKDLALIETPGKLGKKQAGIDKARIIGIVKFETSFQYPDRESWLKDFNRHQVEDGDPLYGFKDDQPKWGWLVNSYKPLKPYVPAPKRRGIVFASNCGINSQYNLF